MNLAHSVFLRFMALSVSCFFGIASISLQQNVVRAHENPHHQVTEYKIVETPPVKRIVLFNSGLAQIVHQGEISGDCQVNLQFDSRDVNDVLKSLIFESGSGFVRAVEYKPAPDAQDIAARKLGPAITLAQTLQKYRGESVSLKTSNGVVTGSILSVENRQQKDSLVETVTLLNDSGLVSYAIGELSSIKFEDENLRKDFALAMQGLKESRTEETKQLSLLFEGDRERTVKFSYLVEAPIWRMTYRLDLKSDKSPLQGWAHIDNSSGLDWDKVRLELRSGHPQSFYVNLFSPIQMRRDTVGLEIFDLQTSNILLSQFNGKELGFGGGGGGGFGGRGPGGGSGGVFGGAPPPRAAAETEPGKMNDINSAIQAAGNAGRTEEMVVFVIQEPVSVAAGRSAMIPVVTEEIPCELFSMFDVRKTVTASLIGQIENKTKTPFIPGPATIYRDGNFVGDSAIPRVEIGQKSEVVFGSDPSVNLVARSAPKKQIVKSAKLDEKSALVELVNIRELKYTVTNDDNVPRKILLKVPLEDEDVNPSPDSSIGLPPHYVGHYKFECPAKANTEKVISQTKSVKQELALESIELSNLDQWQQDGADVDGGIREKVLAINEASTRVSQLSAELHKETNAIQSIRDEQKRLTSVINAVKSDQTASKRFIEALSTTENELQSQREKIKKLEENLSEARQRLIELK